MATLQAGAWGVYYSTLFASVFSFLETEDLNMLQCDDSTTMIYLSEVHACDIVFFLTLAPRDIQKQSHFPN